MSEHPIVSAAASVRVSQQGGNVAVHLSRELPQFDLVEVDDTIAANETDRVARQLLFQPGEHPPELFVPGPTLQRTADPQQGLYLPGERHLTYFHPGAGQRIPIPGVLFHLGWLTEEIPGFGSSDNDGIWDDEVELPSGVVKVYKHDPDNHKYVAAKDGDDNQIIVRARDWSHLGLKPGWVALFQHNQSRHWFAIPMQHPLYGCCELSPGLSPSWAKAGVPIATDGSENEFYTDGDGYLVLGDHAPAGAYVVLVNLNVDWMQGGDDPSDAFPDIDPAFSPSAADNDLLTNIRNWFKWMGDAGYCEARITKNDSQVALGRSFVLINHGDQDTLGGLSCHVLVNLAAGDKINVECRLMDLSGNSADPIGGCSGNFSIAYLGVRPLGAG